MKFLDWMERIDHIWVPLTVDLGLSVFLAGLITGSLELIFAFAV